MSHKQWSEADIFAYLDGGLSDAKRAALESQCAQDSKLRHRVKQAHQVLNVTQDLMQVVPLQEPPRNYLLTPEMVSEPVKQQSGHSGISMLWMRLATAATAAAFVITMGLNLMARGMLFGGQMLPYAASPVSPADTFALEDSTELSPDTGLAESGEAVAELQALSTEASVEAPMGKSAPVVEELPPGMAPGPRVGVGGGGDVGASTPAGDGSGPAEADALNGVLEEEVPLIEESDSVDVAVLEPATADVTSGTLLTPVREGEDVPPPLPVEPRPSYPDWLLMVSVGLGILTLILGGLTWWRSRYP